jgi:hypothetical protein
MADINDIKTKVAEKIASVDLDAIKDEVKALDMGVLYTKAQDAVAALDIEGKKQAVIDFLDSPEMDKLKGVGRTVKDFCGFVPNYAQSIPGMIKDAMEKISK